MSKPTIYIAAGHGGSDPGACAGVYVEKLLTLKTALACREYLKDYNCGVIMARTADKGCTVAHKMEEVEQKCPSLVLEIHYNAGGGEGCEVYYWHNHAPSKALAQAVLSQMTALGQKSRGIKASRPNTNYNFGMCRQAATTGIPSILGEYAFVDNAKDQAKINSDAKLRAIGEAYAKAAVSYLGLKKKAAGPPKPSGGGKIDTGDIVQFAGGKVYGSSTATAAASTRGASKCKVTATAPDARHPYHLISQDGKGVYGWVDAAAVGAASGTAKSVEVGCQVTINKGAVYGGLTSARGSKVPTAQIAPKKHTVSKIQVNEGVREALLREIVSWVAVASLTRV